jgi:hypothetical protein
MSNTVQQLNEKIKNNRLIAGRNIKLEYTGNGIRIHGSAENTGGAAVYNGGFKVIKDGDNLKVVFGEDHDNVQCGGFAFDMMTSVRVPVISFPITSDTHYITLRLVYNIVTKLYSAEITIKDDAWDDAAAPDDKPYLTFYLASYSNGTITQYYKVDNDSFMIDLNGKYWL